MNIGERIKHFRELSGMSGKKLAEKVGLDSSQIYKIESNVSKPSLESLEKICNELNIPLSEFFSEEKSEMPLHIQRLLLAVRDLPPEMINKVIEFVELTKSIIEISETAETLNKLGFSDEHIPSSINSKQK